MSKFGKYFLLVTGFALLATFARIPGAIINVHAHDRSCSLGSLKGTYAWRRTGVNKSLGGPIAETGLDFFNGDGSAASLARPGSATFNPTTGPMARGRTEATRSIRIVPGRSSIRTAHSATT